MDNIHTQEYHSIGRPDGQKCPVSVDEKSGEIKQKSAAFYAYNRTNYKNKLQLAMKNPIANSIFEFFVSEMDNTNAMCVSMATLEKLFNLKRNALSKHIKLLSDNNFISIFKIGNMNAYAVNAYVVWTQGDANIWKAKFTATMYLNHDEQTAKIQSQFTKKVTT
jgi:hypothetical protein